MTRGSVVECGSPLPLSPSQTVDRLAAEAAQINIALTGALPGHAESVAAIGSNLRKGGSSVANFGEGWIEKRFVAADVIGVAHATGRDFHEIAGFHFGATGLVAGSKGDSHSGGFHRDDFTN